MQCHLCARFYRNLAQYVRRRHQINPDDYRKLVGLKLTLARCAALGQEAAHVRTRTTGILESAQQAIQRITAREAGEMARSLRRTRRAQGRACPRKDEAP